METESSQSGIKWRGILWQGALTLISVVVVYVSVYQVSWARSPHWIEAFRDRYKVVNVVENVRWPWIHQDTQYWIVRVRLDEGPVILEGRPPHAPYWSVTYYARQEENASINVQNVHQQEDGTYRIVLSEGRADGVDNHIAVTPGDKRGVIELRITLQDIDEPVLLPSVWQNDLLLVEGTGQ